MSETPAVGPAFTPLRVAALFLAPAAAIALYASGAPDGMSREAWIVAGLALVMAVWWVTEAIPIPITALLPMIVLPITGVLDMKAAAAPYAHPVVMLLLGGFIIAKGVERWGLHARIALNIVLRAGERPAALVGGFMLAAALVSMWISNTATTLMMAPIALSVAGAMAAGADKQRFAVCLLLGTAYAASIGGLGTPVGTPTNLIVIGYIEQETGRRIAFGEWMMLGVPVVAAMLPVAWLTLTKFAFPIRGRAHGAREEVRGALAALGPMTAPEVRTLLVFAAIAFFWIFSQPLAEHVAIAGVKPFAALSDYLIAVAGAILFFFVPAGSKAEPGKALLDWETATQIPWGVYLLFGGGMSLAGAIGSTGLATWLGVALGGLTALPLVLIMLALVTFVIFATELTSNIATASAMMPVVGAIAVAGGLDPILLGAPVAMAASCAFMLPMATGPNAVVFATGAVSIRQMAWAGFLLNLFGVVILTGLCVALVPVIFGGGGS